ncbi:MAG: bifunctional ADP-dependent NAD(P)H-hydrate dehydratase/NAD(P)H-hydrate epimerase [Candidatus Velthaea sp.]
MRVVTSAQMRALDAAALERQGEIALMRKAGDAIAALVSRYARAGPIVGIAGNGNNGGDVFAALASLEGRRARIAYANPAVAGSAARADALARARAAGVDVRPFPIEGSLVNDAGLILDGVLGANARLPLDAHSAALVAMMNASAAPVLALDVPTGCDPNTGATGEPCVRAVATIALGAPKLGCFLEPGRDVTGELWCDDLGMHDIDADGIDDDYFVLSEAEFAALLPSRQAESDKRSAGAPLLVAGSAQFPGAGVLCARGAARAGAGYVTLAAPEGAAASLRAHVVEQVVTTYDDRHPLEGIGAICDLANHSAALGIGPGIGLGDAMGEIARGVMERIDLPMVVDASALFHLSKHLRVLHGKPAVITPHAGEFARLSGKGTIAPGERLTRLRAFVAEYGITTLLKGRTTLIADRSAVHLNPTGTPALATAGTGDVLTGMIATLLAQGLTPVDAARAGAYWHGRAGQLAARERHVGVVAGDIPELLAAAARTVPPGAGPRRIF